MRGRRAHRFGLSLAGALVVALLLTLSSAASTSQTHTGRYGTSLPSPCGALCTAACHVNTIAPDCESRDPNVTLTYSAYQACYSGTISWGDGSPVQSVSFGSQADTDGSAITLTHRYGATQDYVARIIGQITCGPAAGNGFSQDYDIDILAGHYDLVAIGDSYSSGEGAGDYQRSHGTCDRSSRAWARLLPQYTHRVTSTLVIACQGATLKGIFGEQADQPDQIAYLRAIARDPASSPSIVTITVGGDDIGFGDVLKDCFEHNCVTDGRLKGLKDSIKHMGDQLPAAYLAIASAVPRARLIVIGYPQIFPIYEHLQDLFGKPCSWLSRSASPPEYPLTPGFFPADELIDLYSYNALLNTTINDAVAEANFHLVDSGVLNRIEYVDASRSLADHELCTAVPWLVNLGDFLPHFRSQGHPDPNGQIKIAELVAGYINHHL